MKFKATTISPKGRNKYGNYLSAYNVTGKVINTIYSGNDSTTDIGGGTDNKDDTTKKSFLIFLSKTSNSFDGESIAIQEQTDTIKVIGYCDTYVADTYIGKPTGTWTTDDDGNPTWTDGAPQVDYSITGIPTSGMTVEVTDNGTKQTTINITVDNTISANSGTLTIPVRIYLGGDYSNDTYTSIGDDESEWVAVKDDCVIMSLEYSWSVTSSATSPYTMTLTNDSAAINCDSDGNILAGAIRPTCTAQLYYGTELVSDVSYGLSTYSSQNVTGLSIDTETGILTFGSNFSFTGTPLEITITASKGGKTLGKKIMTVVKNFPGDKGQDGTDAVTYWLQLSATTVKYNPNTGVLTPTTITAKVMKQVGENEPVEDTSYTIYYGYDTVTPNTVYTGAVTVSNSYSYITFGLKNSSNEFFKTQTVTILSDGNDGKDGESTYSLLLSNQSASINADSNGNILSGAVRPTCTASLYYGQAKVDATYSISTSATGVSINSSTGVMAFNAGSSTNPFSFSGTSVEITVTAVVNSKQYKAIMTVTKSIAGKDGSDGISYWLVLSATSVQVDVNNNNQCTPATITASAYKQIGESTPVLASDCTIKYGYNVSVPTTTYTGAVTVNATKDYLTFMLLNASGIQVDKQTVQILKNGKDGSNGLKGASIRGAVNYYSQTSTRRFCNGVYNVDYPEDALWIDIILKDNVYYYCNTSYTGSSNDTWSSVSSNWTVADNQFNFVATQVLLADNGKIEFLSSNQLTMLSDDGNTVVAGMSGGDGINIWAGSDNPNNAPFKVDYNGTVTATKGTFGCLTIGDETVGGINADVLQGSSDLGDLGTYDTTLSPRGVKFTSDALGSTTYVNISPTYGVADISDSSGQVESVVYNTDAVGFYTNGMVDANQVRTSSSFYHTEQRYLYNPWAYVKGLKMIICFDNESKITQNTSTKTWLCCGIDTGMSYETYPYKTKVTSTSISVPYTYVSSGTTETGYKTLYVNSSYLGYWVFYGVNADNVPIYAFSGFGSSSIISSQKNADTIYLQV